MPFGQAEWGIFNQNGGPILTADSVFGFEYTREHVISKYPQEKGAFESYNKVRVPYQAKFTFLISGSNGNRAQLFETLETVVASLDLVTVVSPEVSYGSANVYRHSYKREATAGAKLVKVDVWCEEVRVVTADQETTGQPKNIKATDAQSPNGVSTAQDGTAQADQASPIPPTAASPQAPSGTLGAGTGVSGEVATFPILQLNPDTGQTVSNPIPGSPAALDPVGQGVIAVPF
jgi:hypothetical protein